MKHYIKSTMFAFAAMSALASCSDSNEPGMPKIDENFQGIVLNIPNNFGTRASSTEDLTTPDEEKVNNLKVVIYKKNNYATPAAVASFSGNEVQGINHNNYTQLPIVLAEGDYKVYVVANTDGYTLSQTIDNASETNLTAASFSGLNPISASELTGENRKYLPMSCHHKDLKTTPNGTAIGTDAFITITRKQATAVYADLTFCVAKVRSTILNNVVSDLKMADADPLKIGNYSTSAGLLVAENNPTWSTADKTLSGASYFEYPKEGGNEVNGATWEGAHLSEALKEGSTHWAWQGVWYIPEGLYTETMENDAKTILKYTFSTEAYNSSRILGEKTGSPDYNAGIERGKFYEVIGYTTTKDVTLQVRVRPWEYHKYTIELE